MAEVPQGGVDGVVLRRLAFVGEAVMEQAHGNTEVIVTERGMRVRVFVFRWVFIPWEDVLGVTVPPIRGGNGPKLWRFVRVPRLTLQMAT